MASGKTVSATRRATVSTAQFVTAPTVGSSKSAEQTATTTREVTTTTSGSPKSAEQVADTTRVVKTTTTGSSKPAEQTAGTTRAMKTTTVRSTKSASQKRQTAASSTTNPMKTAPTPTHINDTVTPATGLMTETLPPGERGTVARSLATTNRPAARGGPHGVFTSTTQRHSSHSAVSREYDASVTDRGMHVISDTSLPPAAAYRSTDIVDSDGATTAPAKETAEVTGAAAAAGEHSLFHHFHVCVCVCVCVYVCV